eukprot:3029864-Rhodomonas_salina.2
MSYRRRILVLSLFSSIFVSSISLRAADSSDTTPRCACKKRRTNFWLSTPSDFSRRDGRFDALTPAAEPCEESRAAGSLLSELSSSSLLSPSGGPSRYCRCSACGSRVMPYQMYRFLALRDTTSTLSRTLTMSYILRRSTPRRFAAASRHTCTSKRTPPSRSAAP